MERICVLCNTSKTCFGGWHRFEQKEDGTFHSGTIDWIISSPSIPTEKTKDRMYLCNACWSPNFHAFRKIKPGGKKKGPKHRRSEEEEEEDEKVKRARSDHELRIMKEEEEKLKKIKETEERLKKIREEEEMKLKKLREEQQRKQKLRQEEQLKKLRTDHKVNQHHHDLFQREQEFTKFVKENSEGIGFVDPKQKKSYVLQTSDLMRSCIICNTNSTCKNGWNTLKLRDGKFYNFTNGTTVEWIISTPIITSEDLQKDMWTCNACWNKNYWAFRRLRDQGNKINNFAEHMPLKKRKIIFQSLNQDEMHTIIAGVDKTDEVDEEMMEMHSHKILETLGNRKKADEIDEKVSISNSINDHKIVGDTLASLAELQCFN